MAQFLISGWHDDDGATAIEYGLIASGIALAIVVTVTTLGTNLQGFFTTLAGAFA